MPGSPATKQQLVPPGLGALPDLVHRLQLALAADEFDGRGCGELRRQRNRRGRMREASGDRLADLLNGRRESIPAFRDGLDVVVTVRR